MSSRTTYSLGRRANVREIATSLLQGSRETQDTKILPIVLSWMDGLTWWRVHYEIPRCWSVCPTYQLFAPPRIKPRPSTKSPARHADCPKKHRILAGASSSGDGSGGLQKPRAARFAATGIHFCKIDQVDKINPPILMLSIWDPVSRRALCQSAASIVTAIVCKSDVFSSIFHNFRSNKKFIHCKSICFRWRNSNRITVSYSLNLNQWIVAD